MMIFKYRAIALEAIPSKLGLLKRLKRFFLRLLGRKEVVRITYDWVIKTEEAIKEGYIKAESMEYAIFKLINEERLYPIEIVSLTLLESMSASRLIHLQEVKKKLQK